MLKKFGFSFFFMEMQYYIGGHMVRKCVHMPSLGAHACYHAIVYIYPFFLAIGSYNVS